MELETRQNVLKHVTSFLNKIDRFCIFSISVNQSQKFIIRVLTKIVSNVYFKSIKPSKPQTVLEIMRLNVIDGTCS